LADKPPGVRLFWHCGCNGDIPWSGRAENLFRARAFHWETPRVCARVRHHSLKFPELRAEIQTRRRKLSFVSISSLLLCCLSALVATNQTPHAAQTYRKSRSVGTFHTSAGCTNMEKVFKLARFQVRSAGAESGTFWKDWATLAAYQEERTAKFVSTSAGTHQLLRSDTLRANMLLWLLLVTETVRQKNDRQPAEVDSCSHAL
jgi:hypothetical protein